MYFKNLIQQIKLPFRKDKELYRRLYLILGFYPKNIAYYKQALLHKSVSVKGKNGRWQNNERLEFLGDAILDAIVGDIVYRHFEGKREGFLTNTRSKLVQRETLGKLAVEVGLDKLIVSHQQKQTAHNSYMAGNAFEALVGAIYLDYGYEQCMRFMEKRILGKLVDIDKIAHKEVNFKSKLLEWSQKNRIRLDFKDQVQSMDKTGSSIFVTMVVIEGLDCGRGKGYSKKESQQNAARETLLMLKQEEGLEESVFAAKSRRTAMEEQPEALLPDIPVDVLSQPVPKDTAAKQKAQQATKEVKTAGKDNKSPKDRKPSKEKEIREPKSGKEAREPKSDKESREPKANREQRDQKDQKGQKERKEARVKDAANENGSKPTKENRQTPQVDAGSDAAKNYSATMRSELDSTRVKVQVSEADETPMSIEPTSVRTDEGRTARSNRRKPKSAEAEVLAASSAEEQLTDVREMDATPVEIMPELISTAPAEAGWDEMVAASVIPTKASWEGDMALLQQQAKEEEVASELIKMDATESTKQMEADALLTELDAEANEKAATELDASAPAKKKPSRRGRRKPARSFKDAEVSTDASTDATADASTKSSTESCTESSSVSVEQPTSAQESA